MISQNLKVTASATFAVLLALSLALTGSYLFPSQNELAQDTLKNNGDGLVTGEFGNDSENPPIPYASTADNSFLEILSALLWIGLAALLAVFVVACVIFINKIKNKKLPDQD